MVRLTTQPQPVTKNAFHHEQHNGISQMLQSIDLVIGVGPHSALKGSPRDIFENMSPGVDFAHRSLLLRASYGLRTMLTAAGRLFQQGVELNIQPAISIDKSRKQDKTV